MHTLSLHSKFNNSSKVNSKLNTVAQPYLPRYLSYAMPQDSFTRTNQVPNQNQKEEYYRNLETIEKLDLRGEKIKSLPNLTNVEKELWGPKSLEEMDKLQTAGVLHLEQTKKIKSLPELTNVEKLFGPKSLENMDKLQTAGVLSIDQTQIKSLPKLTNVKKLWAPWTLGEDILKVGCPKLTNVKSILVINESNLACKDFPSLIQIGEDNKIFHFEGNKNIETMDNLLQLVNKNRQKKGLLPLEAQYIESDQYKIIYPEENSTSNERTDMLLNRPNLLNMQELDYNLGINPRVNDYSFDTINPTYNKRTDMLSNRPNLLNMQQLDYDLGINNPFSRMFEYNNQNKNIDFMG